MSATARTPCSREGECDSRRREGLRHFRRAQGPRSRRRQREGWDCHRQGHASPRRSATGCSGNMPSPPPGMCDVSAMPNDRGVHQRHSGLLSKTKSTPARGRARDDPLAPFDVADVPVARDRYRVLLRADHAMHSSFNRGLSPRWAGQRWLAGRRMRYSALA